MPTTLTATELCDWFRDMLANMDAADWRNLPAPVREELRRFALSWFRERAKAARMPRYAADTTDLAPDGERLLADAPLTASQNAALSEALMGYSLRASGERLGVSHECIRRRREIGLSRLQEHAIATGAGRKGSRRVNVEEMLQQYRALTATQTESLGMIAIAA